MSLYSSSPDPQHHKNMFIALILCAVLIVAWQFMIEIPKREKLASWHQQQKIELEKKAELERITQAKAAAEPLSEGSTSMAEAARIPLESETLHGSISLRGTRIDLLTLANYHQTPDKNSPEVVLLNPSKTKTPYFLQFGWLSEQAGLRLPDNNSLWQTSDTKLTPDTPLNMQWYNGEGVTFMVTIRMDESYMFTIEQQVSNQSGNTVSLKPYALINRTNEDTGTHYFISHEGPLGVIDGKLEELAYDDIAAEKQHFTDQRGWIGFTDKYWLTAIIPDQSQPFTANFSSYQAGQALRYQADYFGPQAELVSGERQRTRLHFFAGAKKVDVLDYYNGGVDAIGLKPLALFDRAVDFGMLYFLTKPIFLTLNFFYKVVGNFGLAIILLTILIKLIMFPLANKSYHSMTQLRALQPDMARLKAKHGDDRIKMQQELLALYKKEKVNPASGCLPMLIQLPVFFALYKVLFVTIEMRHAPFWGPWQDLSAMDPTNLFTLFGLVPWDAPNFLMLGILPILMSVTMMVQMRLQPTPQDPVQAKVIKLMPWMLMIVVARMPAGLVLYWVVSNFLSIIQQAIITARYNAAHPDKQAK